MALLEPRRRPSDAIPTSSMADIAFLLLIFFLVTTVFPRDSGLAIVLPDEIAPVSPSNVLHLLIAPSGAVAVQWGESPQRQVVRSEDVADVWRDGVARNPRLIAAVKTDPDAAYGRMVDVLDQLQLAGASRVSLQVAGND